MHRREFLARAGAGVLAAPAVAGRLAAARARVPVGYCGGLQKLEAAKAAGFDYLELNTTEMATLPEDAFERAVSDVRRVGLPTPTANLFLPAALKVTGPAADPAAQMTYVRMAFDRLHRLGVQVLVFGSGGARRVPEGFGREAAVDQLVDFGRRIAPEARSRGITVAVEPLRREECNIVNTAGEGLRLVEAIGDPGFQLMIDFYHLASEHEDPQIVLRARDHLRHLHMANPHGRVFPRQWAEFEYGPFFENLRRIGYAGRISIEASTNALAADAPPAIALLRRAFEP
jgi:D-psicose/D-tagatose/L-ribulose 3-epimerase